MALAEPMAIARVKAVLMGAVSQNTTSIGREAFWSVDESRVINAMNARLAQGQ
jgi:hypothetical protein